MAFGLSLSTALGPNDITDLSSFRILATETKTESVTTGSQTFTYPAPSGWTASNGTFYILPNSDGILPSFSASGTSTTATFDNFNSIYKANSWVIYWLVKTGTDTPSGYGIYIKNGSNQTVISDTTDTLLVKSSGTLSSYTTSNSGFRSFTLPSGFSVANDALFVKLVDGHNFFALSRFRYNEATNYRVGSTVSTSIQYFVLERSNALTPTGGYGLGIYKPNGDLAYDSGYDIFPSNGQSLKVDGNSTATINTSKDVWVNLNFGTPAPFCPLPGTSQTFNLLTGVQRSGSTISIDEESVVDDATSSNVAEAHDNTALIVQR
jgi:hypothetical protein